MTEISDFSKATQNMVDRNIDRPFRDAIPKLERWFGSTGGFTRSRLIFFERYWGENSRPRTRFEYEDQLQILRRRYLRSHVRYTVRVNKKGRIQIRNRKGQFVRQPRYFRQLYTKHKK